MMRGPCADRRNDVLIGRAGVPHTSRSARPSFIWTEPLKEGEECTSLALELTCAPQKGVSTLYTHSVH